MAKSRSHLYTYFNGAYYGYTRTYFECRFGEGVYVFVYVLGIVSWLYRILSEVSVIIQ